MPPARVAPVPVSTPARPGPADSPLALAALKAERVAQARAVEGRAADAPASGNFKDALLAQIKSGKTVFYNMVVAQAQKIEVAGDRVTFTFSPNQRTLRDNFEQQRGWLESLAQQVAGRRITAACVLATAPPADGGQGGSDEKSADQKSADRKSALREQALADAGVQTMLEVFPAEIRDVEEM